MVRSALSENVERCLEQLVAAVKASNCTVATAESLTGGQLASALSAAPDAGDWFRGGVVAYHPDVKHTLLTTPPGPVVTASTAAAMASSSTRLLGAQYAVALTGVGGPDPEEGEPAGTVYIATCERDGLPKTELHRFPGDPIEVMERTICAALEALTLRIETR